MNIIIVDDDCLVSGALKTILEVNGDIRVTAIGADGREAIELYRKFWPDVLLMDIRMKEMNGLDAAGEILREFPDAKILLLTTFSDDEYIIKALRLGAKGYLLKQDYASILPALRAVDSGQIVFGHEIVRKLPNLIQEKTPLDYSEYEINDREYEIIRWIAEGLSNKEIAAKGCSNKEIADALFLSEGTVRNYLSSILDKLSLRDRTQIAIFYYQHK